MIEKVCIHCKEHKIIAEFYKHPKMKDGHLNKCKSCCIDNSIKNDYWGKNPEKHRQYINQRNAENRPRQNANAKKARNKTYEQQLQNFHQDEVGKCYRCYEIKPSSEFNKNRYRKTGLSSYCNTCRKIYKKERFYIDKLKPEFKIKEAIRHRLHKFKVQNKSKIIKEFMGCTIDQLKTHLESKFYNNPRTGEAMTWDNWSLKGWHVDHIIPLAAAKKFALENGTATETELIKLSHYTNLQPLWAEENLTKNAKLL